MMAGSLEDLCSLEDSCQQLGRSFEHHSRAGGELLSQRHKWHFLSTKFSQQKSVIFGAARMQIKA